jgi:hypothetical protein
LATKIFTPIWEGVIIPRRFDLAELLPAELPKSRRFETETDTVERSIAAEQKLRKAGPLFRKLAERLADCRNGDCSCRLPICPICARSFRRWFAANVMALADRTNNPNTITLFCATVPEGQLHCVDLAKSHDQLRHRLRRAGVSDAVAVGGTEVAYRAKQNDWLLHHHVLVGDAESHQFDRLRSAWSKSEIETPVRISPLRDPARQLGYLLKFASFHRPGTESSARRARAYP